MFVYMIVQCICGLGTIGCRTCGYLPSCADMAEKQVESKGKVVRDFNPLEVTPEQRLMLRSIPYFSLPSYEALPDLSHVQAKVNTHNQTYCRPKSAPPKKPIIVHSHKQDYSHVESKINTRRHVTWGPGRSLGSGGDNVRMRRHVTWGPGRSLDSGGGDVMEEKRYPRQRPASAEPSTAKVKAATWQDFSHVKPKVGSLSNLAYQQGNRFKIPNHPKVEIKAAPKVRVWDNIHYQPKGGNIKYPTYEVDHLRKNAKSKVDQTDPNPAHRLKRSLTDLSVLEGKQINPRFNPDLRSRSLRRVTSQPTGNSNTPISRRSTIHSYHSSQPKELETTASRMQQEREEVVIATRDSTSSEESINGVEPELYGSEQKINRDAFSLVDDTMKNTSRDDNEIIDIEVTNTDTETTVNLVHLLGLRSRDATEEDSWDQSDSESESDDDDILIPAQFDGPIPALYVLDEDNSLVETIHKGRPRLEENVIAGASQ